MSKSREERLCAAREKLDKLKTATKTKVRADRMDWRPKALIWLHPDTDIIDRRRVWFAKEVDEKEDKEKKGRKKGGRKGKRIVNVPFVVPDDPECDPFYLLRKVLKEDEDIDGDEVILVVGAGRNKVEYRKGDILGWDDYTFKKSLIPQQDFVCAAILAEDKEGKRPDKLKCQVFSGAKTLGKEIRKEIEAEVDENGEEMGNPFFNPYPFRIEYDETASGADMYSARARPAVEADEDLGVLFEQDVPDLKEETKPEDGEAIHVMLKGYLVYDLEIPEPKDAVFKGPKAKGAADDQVEDSPGPDVAKKKAADVLARKATAEEEVRKRKETEAKKGAEGNKKSTKKGAAKKVARAPEPENPKDDVKVPEGYDDPGPRPDDPNVAWWPNREEGELYDLCPKCDRPVREDDMKCPHKDCGVEYAPAGDAF